MTASPPPAAPPPAFVPPPPRPSRWTAGRVVALVLGLVLLLPGLGLLIGGAALLSADSSNRTADGFLMSDEASFRTSGFALTSDRMDLSTGADWVPVSSALGTARFEVTGAAGADVFIGIAPASEVAGYLGDVRRTVVDDIGVGSGTGRLVDGGPPPGSPGSQGFWTAQASGTGPQQLDWEPAGGNWVLVVMNTDGSAGVDVTGRAGATVPSLDGLAWGLLITGAVCTLAAVVLIVIALRPRSHRAGPPPAGYAPTAGPPPSWSPPSWAPPEPREPADGRPVQPRSGAPDGS